jgi:hypothetical protein
MSFELSESTNYQIWEYHKQFLLLIGQSPLSPIHTARIIFLFTSSIYHIQSFFYKIKLLDNFPVPPTPISLKYFSEYDILVKYVTNKLVELYLKKISPKIVEIDSNNTNLVNAKNLLETYINNRNLDRWNDSTAFAPRNGELDIKINASQKISEWQNPEKWTPIENTVPLGANWNKVEDPIPVDIKNRILSIFYNDINNKSEKIPIKERARQVLDISQNLNDTQKMVAELFEGGSITPPGQNYAILISLLSRFKYSVKLQSEIFVLLGIGLFEASIIAWTIKYELQQCRPIQSIRLYFDNESINYHYGRTTGEYWLPYQSVDAATPPFPDSISGHTIFSTITAIILTKYFGKNIPASLTIHREFLPLFSKVLQPNYDRNTPTFLRQIVLFRNSSSKCNILPRTDIFLNISTWDELAQYAGISRIFGGIHYQSSNLDSAEVGRLLGQELLNYYQSLPN